MCIICWQVVYFMYNVSFNLPQIVEVRTGYSTEVYQPQSWQHNIPLDYSDYSVVQVSLRHGARFRWARKQLSQLNIQMWNDLSIWRTDYWLWKRNGMFELALSMRAANDVCAVQCRSIGDVRKIRKGRNYKLWIRAGVTATKIPRFCFECG